MKTLARRTKRIIIALVTLFALYSIAGFVVLPWVLKVYIVKIAREDLRRQASVESVRFNPYNMRLRLWGFVLNDRTGRDVFVSFDHLYVNFEGAASIYRRGLVVKEIRFEAPFVEFARGEDMRYDFSDLMSAPGEDKPAPEAGAGGAGLPLSFSLNNMQIEDGSAVFNDRAMGVVHRVRSLKLGIPFVSNMAFATEVFVKPNFSAVVNDVEVALEGETKPFSDSLETSLDIRLEGLDIPYYLAYSPVEMNYRVDSALLDTDVRVAYVQPLVEDGRPELKVTGSVGLREVEVTDLSGGPMAALDSLTVEGASVRPLLRTASIEKVTVVRPTVNAVRRPSGEINLTALRPAAAEQAQPETPPAGAEKPSFEFDIDTIAVEDAGLAFTDLTRERPFQKSLDPVDAAVTGLGNAPGKRGQIRVEFENDRGESATLSGEFSINPPSATLNVEAGGLDLAPVGSYLDTVIRAALSRASVYATGTVDVETTPAFTVRYRGDALVRDLSVVEPIGAEELFGFDELGVEGIDAGYNPLYADVRSVTLEGPRLNIVRSGTGINLTEAVVRREGDGRAGGGQKGEGSVPEIKVGTFGIRGGSVRFTDRAVDPRYEAVLGSVELTVNGLSSAGAGPADLTLSASLDKHAPLKATGAVDPISGVLYADVKASFSGYDLSSTTPYSAKYLGYKIQQGKLFLDLDYLIEDKKLVSQNGVVFDRLNFGESVKSEEATGLPVRFAVNLLKDRQGKVRIDLPVEGRIDDPEFRIGGLVLQAFVNLIVKAATSPFAVLGALVGGGEELSYVEFEPGAYAVTPAIESKLSSLAEALYERPHIELEVRGYVNREQDLAALKLDQYMRKLKAEKLKEMIEEGRPGVPLKEVEITGDEYEDYLWLAYKKGDFEKPRNFLGFVKRLEVYEMEALMLENIVITEDDLRTLATARAQAVKDRLVSAGEIAPERIFTVWPETLEPEKKEGLKLSRVEFSLK